MTEVPASLAAGTARPLPVDKLAAAFRDALSGPANPNRPVVQWSDGDAQLLLHVGKLQVRTVNTTLVIAVDTESDEYGIVPLAVRFVFGQDGGPASLVAATDTSAFGHPSVVARWGDLFRDVVWAALTRLVELESGTAAPGGVQVGPEGLHLTVQPRFSVVDLGVAHVRDQVDRGLRAAPARLFAPLEDEREPGAGREASPPGGSKGATA